MYSDNTRTLKDKTSVWYERPFFVQLIVLFVCVLIETVHIHNVHY